MSDPASEVTAIVDITAGGTLLVTVLAVTPTSIRLPTTSLTTDEAKATVTASPADTVSVEASVSSILLSVARVALSTVAAVPSIVTGKWELNEEVILSSMFSLKVRMIFVPSVEVFGALSPVVTSVGRMPSTLWLAEAATAAWVRTASGLAPAVALIVPPLASSLLAAMERPSVSASFAATVYPENTSAAVPVPEA